MKWRLWIVVALFAASCAGPQPPDAWSIERIAEDDDVIVDALCEDVNRLALGSLADDPRLEPTLEELARIAALAGASDALPTMGELTTVLTDDSTSAHARSVALHDLLVDASRALDQATATACETPVFSALYATTGFANCHFELEIPVAAYTLRGEPDTCSSAGIPTHLPCWSTDGDHLAVDCVSGSIVQAVDTDWREAGDPREISIDRVDPDAPPGPVIISPIETPACAALTDLFVVGPAPNDAVPDYDRLLDAASSLDDATESLVTAFVDAAGNPPSLEEFEALVADLDAATATACGLPLVSAWATLTTSQPVLPCWTESGAAYPAFEIIACSAE